MADFFHMGGYAVYVWASYGLALLILVGLLVASLQSLRRKERLLGSLEQGLPRRRRRRETTADAGSGSDGTDAMLMGAYLPLLHEGMTGLHHHGHHHGHDGAVDHGGGFDGGGFDGGGGQ